MFTVLGDYYIFLSPSKQSAEKLSLHPKFGKVRHLRQIFYGTFVFQQSNFMICIGRHVEGRTLALQHGGQNYFLLVSCSTLGSDVLLNVTT